MAAEVAAAGTSRSCQKMRGRGIGRQKIAATLSALLTLHIGFLLFTSAAHAACEEGLEADWSDFERAAWTRLAAGDAFDGALVLAGQVGVHPELSARFLRNILTCERFFRLLPEGEIVLRGIGVRDDLDLSHRVVLARLQCDLCVFNNIVAQETVWDGNVSLRRVKLFGTLDLSRGRFAASLTLSDTQIDERLDVSRATIGGDLVIDGRSHIGELHADSANIAGSLEFQGVEITGSATLWGVTVGRDLVLSASEDGRRTVIGSDAGAASSALRLGSAKIERRISISNTTVHGRIDLDAVRITEDLWLRNCSEVAGPINLVFARVGQNIDLSSTMLNDVDLTGARIGGELRLGAPLGRLTAPVWAPEAELILRNVELSSWTDATGNDAPRGAGCGPAGDNADPWPRRIDVIGFSYQNLGGLGGGSPTVKHDVDWFCAWLDRQEPFSFEPYQHAAAYLRRVGMDEDADDVLYCGKLRQIDNTPSWAGKVTLQIQRGFVGFGYHVERSLIWAGLFILLGQQIFCRTKEARAHHMPVGLAYSIEMFIPGLALRGIHSQIDLKGWQRYYFYVHKFMGWILGSFVVASFLGLIGQ